MSVLTEYQQMAFVITAINNLPHRDDLVEGKTQDGWCPDCCLPCGVLQELIDGDDLDYLLRNAPRSLSVTGYDWWDADQECFDRTWAQAWWGLYPGPNHEDV